MAVLVLLSLFVHSQLSTGVKLKHIEWRVRMLEHRVQHDASEFRDIIDNVFEKLNGSESQQPTATTSQCDCKGNEKGLPAKSRVFQDELTMQYDSLRYGFASEKLHLRRFLDTFKRDFDGFKSKSMSYAQQVNDSLFQRQENLKQRVIHTSNGLDSQNEALSTEMTEVKRENKKLKAKIETMDAELKSTRAALELLSNESKTRRLDQWRVLSFMLDTTVRQFENSNYILMKERKNFEDANQHCLQIGGYLAEVTSKTKYDFLVQIVDENSWYQDIWIGGIRGLEAMEWIWVHSKQRLSDTFTAWVPGEGGGNVQHCVQMWADHNYRWDNDFCSASKYYICEISDT